jgi:hypothetical protein
VCVTRSGNNTGRDINIAIVPPGSTDVGTSAGNACVNIWGHRLLGG